MGQQEKDVEMVGAQRRISVSDSERWRQTRTATTSTMETQAWDESDGKLLSGEQAIVHVS
jgi:hypothetical protein